MSVHDGETLRLAFPDIANPPYTKLSYGLPFTEACANHVTHTFRKKYVYILASRSLSRETDYVKALERALGDAHAGTWIGLLPHPYWIDLVPIINDMRAKQADTLIALGGSSLADGAKAISYAIANDVRTVEDMNRIVARTEEDRKRSIKVLLRDGIGKEPYLTLIFIPTTLSGGEYSKYAGGTNHVTHQKDQLSHAKMFASLVILDPQLTVTTPESIWLQSGVRAIDHCCEAICSTNAKPTVDQASAEALKLLIPGLLGTKRDPTDLDARLKSMLGANRAMVALTEGVMKGASHGIGHQLGPLGVGHGHTSCVLLPSVMKYNAARASEAQSDILAQQEHLMAIFRSIPDVIELLSNPEGVGSTSDVGDVLRAVFNELGMPATLREVGVGRDKFEALAETTLNDPYAKTNPIPLTRKEQVLEILDMVAGN